MHTFIHAINKVYCKVEIKRFNIGKKSLEKKIKGETKAGESGIYFYSIAL